MSARLAQSSIPLQDGSSSISMALPCLPLSVTRQLLN